jgi:hypothetical protein
MEPARVVIPAPLLEQLRARRERNRAERFLSQPAEPPPIRSTVDLVVSVSAESQIPGLARDFVDGMNHLQSQVEAEYDAFLLDPRMGPMTYLTADGRILWDHRTWDGADLEIVTSLDEAVASVVVGARKTGIQDLLSLIPALENGQTCPRCDGTRTMNLGPITGLCCRTCFGRGEVDDRLLGLAREAETRLQEAETRPQTPANAEESRRAHGADGPGPGPRSFGSWVLVLLAIAAALELARLWFGAKPS